jgi:hypothetical protein
LAAGGGGAFVGISWLPIIFGPYFAVKLAGAGEGPSSWGKALGFSVLGLAVCFAPACWQSAALRPGLPRFLVPVLAMWWFAATTAHPTYQSMVSLFLVLVSAFIPGIGWRSLGSTLLAYAFATRIPVLIVMFVAMRAG